MPLLESNQTGHKKFSISVIVIITVSFCCRYLLMTGLPVFDIKWPVDLIVTVGMMGICIIYILSNRSHFLAQKTGLLDYVFLLYIFYNACSVFWSYNKQAAFDYAFFVFVLGLIYFCFKLKYSLAPKVFIDTLLILAAFISLVLWINTAFNAWKMHQEWSAIYPGYKGFTTSIFTKFKSIIGSKNHIAMYGYLLVTTAALGMIHTQKDWAKLLCKMTIALNVVGISFLLARSSIVGLLVFALCLIAFKVIKNINWRWVIPLASIAIGCIYFANHNDYFQKINVVSSFQSNSIQFRFEMIRRAWDMFLQQPVFGNGLNQWHTLNMQYGIYDFFNTDRRFAHPHNDFVRHLMELGVVGFCIFYGMLLLQIKNGIRKYKTTSSNRTKQILAVLISAIIGYHVISIFDEMLYKLPRQALLILLWALLSVELNESNKTNRLITKGLLITFTIISLGLLVASIHITQQHGLAIKAATTKDLATKKYYAASAHSVFYKNHYRQPVKHMEAQSLYWLDQKEEAIITLEEALQSEPYYINSLILLARIYLDLGKEEQAGKYLNQAYAIDLCNEYVAHEIARYYLAKGQFEEAKEWSYFTNLPPWKKERLLKTIANERAKKIQ